MDPQLVDRLVTAGASAGTLVSGFVAELAGDPALSFREIGPIELKGFTERISVFEALGTSRRRSQRKEDVDVGVAR